MIVDNLLVPGGTIAATAFLIELEGLGGRNKHPPAAKNIALLTY